MKALLRIAFWGLGISALGTLPLGTINVAAMQIAIAEGVWHASLFGIGAAMVEVAYVRVSLVGINWIRHRPGLLRMMDWLAFAIVATLAVASFMAAASPVQEGKNVILNADIHPFALGVTMSALNPMQIPFWFGWSAVLFSKGILQANAQQYNWYSVGIGFGTLLGLAVFIAGGRILVTHMQQHLQVVNYCIAGIFAITACVFLYKIAMNKGAAAQLEANATTLNNNKA